MKELSGLEAEEEGNKVRAIMIATDWREEEGRRSDFACLWCCEEDVKDKRSERVRVVVGEIYLSDVEAAAGGSNKRANQRTGVRATLPEQARASIAALIDKKAIEELFTCFVFI